jgi:predicted RNase H-like nuclease
MEEGEGEGNEETAMKWIAGVDGCRAGWIVMLLQRTGRAWEHQITLCLTFADVLALDPAPAVIAIDIPIGLLDKPQLGGRECDRQARKLLGRRASSIFTPPTRSMLKATHYEHVRTRGLSIQAFNLLPKIREVDQLMTPTLQQRVHEAHPELAFMSLAGAPMQCNKKTREGREERLHTLGKVFRGIRRTFESACMAFKRSEVAMDDLLDAYILAWTAHQVANGLANRFPANPPVDQKGLRMAIWY